MTPTTQILLAMSAMASFGVALFYLRFRLQTGDRFFTWFAIAFALLGANWLLLAVLNPRDDVRHLVYVLRLAAFLGILWAAIDKNRAGRGGGPESGGP
jgi:hypothetical protein